MSLLPHCNSLLPTLATALQDSTLPPTTVGHAIVAVARLAEVIGSEHIVSNSERHFLVAGYESELN